MKNANKFVAAVVAVFASVAFPDAPASSRPAGFRFLGNRLTVKPYVSLFYTYDTNIESSRHAEDDSIYSIEPGADLEWKGDKWRLHGSLFYRYKAYQENSDSLDENSYGEALNFNYASSKADEQGWTLALGERFAHVSQSDDIGSKNGRGIWRDRDTVDVTGAYEYRFTPRFHADVSAQYNRLDYDNDPSKYSVMHGWSEYSGGVEAGYAFSKWTDVLLGGSYSRYDQDAGDVAGTHYADYSTAWAVMGGVGSRATERISYRALMGASWFEYGNCGEVDCGWTYSLSSSWRVRRDLMFTLIGSSYYQPSERNIGQATKVYSLGAGVSYLTLGDRLNLTGNITWRYDENAYSNAYYDRRSAYDETVLSVRLGADYLLNRYASLFASVTWEEEWCDNSNEDYDYDRFRGTVGVRLHY